MTDHDPNHSPNNQYSAHVREYLSKVYMRLLQMSFLAFINCIINIQYNLPPTFLIINSILPIILIITYLMVDSNYLKQLMALTIAFNMGGVIAPLVSIGLDIDRMIIPLSLIGSSIIFVSMSISAFYSKTYLSFQVGGLLLSTLNLSVGMVILNSFVQSEVLFLIEVYISMVVFSLYVLYDTQNIIFKAKYASKTANSIIDYNIDALNLFLNFLNIFVKILELMLYLSDKKNNNEDDDSNHKKR